MVNVKRVLTFTGLKVVEIGGGLGIVWLMGHPGRWAWCLFPGSATPPDILWAHLLMGVWGVFFIAAVIILTVGVGTVACGIIKKNWEWTKRITG